MCATTGWGGGGGVGGAGWEIFPQHSHTQICYDMYSESLASYMERESLADGILRLSQVAEISGVWLCGQVIIRHMQSAVYNIKGTWPSRLFFKNEP